MINYKAILIGKIKGLLNKPVRLDERKITQPIVRYPSPQCENMTKAHKYTQTLHYILHGSVHIQSANYNKIEITITTKKLVTNHAFA